MIKLSTIKDPKLRAAIAKQVGQDQTVMREATPRERRMRQDQEPELNKLELDFYDFLTRSLPSGTKIWKQSLRLRLGNGIWYKPDFAAFAGWTQKPTQLTCWEVKGPHVFRGGFENLKVAAATYPELSFELVWKDSRGGWVRQAVKS